jgi:hypothetical protein
LGAMHRRGVGSSAQRIRPQQIASRISLSISTSYLSDYVRAGGYRPNP